MTNALPTAACAALMLALGTAVAAPANPAADPVAMRQLINAVSLDLMSETTVDACVDMVAAAPQLRAAWAAWRERHQLAPLRMVMTELKRRQDSSLPSWDAMTGPMRERVLRDPAPYKVCAARGAGSALPTRPTAARGSSLRGRLPCGSRSARPWLRR